MNRWEIGFANPNLLGAIAATAVVAMTALAIYIPKRTSRTTGLDPAEPVARRWSWRQPTAAPWIRGLWAALVATAIIVLAGTVSRSGLLAVIIGLVALGGGHGQ